MATSRPERVCFMLERAIQDLGTEGFIPGLGEPISGLRVPLFRLRQRRSFTREGPFYMNIEQAISGLRRRTVLRTGVIPNMRAYSTLESAIFGSRRVTCGVQSRPEGPLGLGEHFSGLGWFVLG